MSKKIITKTPEKAKINSFQGELRILSQTKGRRQKVELWLLNEKTNENNWRYENLEGHKDQFAETPLLVAYVGTKIGDGHNFDQYIDRKTGETKASFLKATAERIVGYFKDAKDIRIEERDGVKWIVGTAYIWRWYAQELVEYLTEQGLEGMPISIETLVDEMYMDGTTEVFTKYQILGTTILGKDVAPAVKDANIRVLQAIGAKDVKELTLRVASHQAESTKSAQNNNKGEKTKSMPKILNIADMREKFSGYTVLAVNGMSVALLSNDNCRPYTYTFGEDEETVVPERIVAVNASSVFGEGENTVEVDVEAIVGDINARLNSTTNALNSAVAENARLQSEITAMKTAEKERRKNAVKEAMKAQIATNNSAFEGDISEEMCEDLMTEECLENYACMESDGKWVGEQRAVADIDARCMQMLRSKHEQKTAQNSRKYAWDMNNGADNSGSDDVNASVARILL